MKKLYAVVIDSIGNSYQHVQMNHVIAKFASKNIEVDWDKQTFVCLEASEIKLQKVLSKLEQEGIKYHAFIEPDIGNKLTAIACITDEYKIFKNLSLI